jgi:beta-fructofuranosidase
MRTCLRLLATASLLPAVLPAAQAPEAGLVLHLDAAALHPAEGAAGATLQAWPDLSGKANHLAQPDEASRPVLVANAANGLPAVHFSGKEFMDGPAALPEGSQDLTLVAVWRRSGGDGAQAVVEQAAGGPGRRASLLTVYDRYGFNGQNNDQHDLLRYRAGLFTLSVLTVEDGSTIRLWHNDNAEATGAMGLIDGEIQKVGRDRLRLGAKAMTGGELLVGDIAEVLVYDRALDLAEIAALNEQLGAKWGIGMPDDKGNRHVVTVTKEVMDRGPDYTSKVPRFSFGATLAEQQAQLATNPLLQRFAASRAALAADRYRPLYHYVNPENWLNDPNGLCFWQGRWHLFYQGYPPEDPRQHWGHAVSDDLVHWRDLPYAIYPNPEECCFSGTTFVDGDRVIACYHGTRVGTMVAVSSDPLLLNWEKVTGKAVMPFPKPGEPRVPYSIFDPCLWKRGETYYALTAGCLPNGPGGKPVRAEFLHRSRDLAVWEYLHPFLEGDQYGLVGDDGACPYFWPIGDRHILLHFSHMSGGKYLLGDYDTTRDKFVVTGGGTFNFGPSWPAGVHAPSAAPDGNGGVIVIFNLNAAKPTAGWNQIMSLPRRLTLLGRDEISQEPAGALESLRAAPLQVPPMPLPANREVVLEGVQGAALEIAAEIDLRGAPLVELNVLRAPNREEFTRIACFRELGYARGPRGLPGGRDSLVSLDTSYSSALPDVQSRAPETAPVYLEPGEPLRLRVFVDRSVVEVFVNGKQCVAARVYPGREDSLGVSLRSQGVDAALKSLTAWPMRSIY